jgi:putative hydrolase of HD superfamily
MSDLFTIYRWSNLPAIVRFNEADSSFSNAMLSFFTFYDQNRDDLLKLMHNKIVENIPKIILSDIPLNTKKKIIEKDPNIWNRVLDISKEELKDFVKDDNIMTKITKEYKMNKNYIKVEQYLRLITAKNEININKRVFDEFYEEPFQENEKSLNTLKLDDALKNKINIYNSALFDIIIRLTHLKRWNKMHRNINSSVSAHSYYVMFTAYILSLSVNVNNELLFKIITASLFHDLPEAFTGDVISPTKRKVEKLDKIITQIEEDYVLSWSGKNKQINSVITDIIPLIINPFKDDYGRFVRTADLLAAIIECSNEIITGNSNENFRRAFFGMKSEIKDIAPMDIYSIIDEIEYNTFK